MAAILSDKPTIRRVMVLEDELIISMMLLQHLKNVMRCEVDSFTRVADAEDCAQKQHYDLAILDIRLPDGESYELARTLIQKNCAVVFHSGHGDKDLIQDIRPSVFCRKPSSKAQIDDAILRAVESSAGK